jgi:uncharacterized protein (DUF2225 family)
LPEKTIYIGKAFNPLDDKRYMYIYDSKVVSNYQAEKRRQEEQRKQARAAEDEAKRKAISEGITF